MVDRETVLLWSVTRDYLLASVNVKADTPKPVLIRVVEAYSNNRSLQMARSSVRLDCITEKTTKKLKKDGGLAWRSPSLRICGSSSGALYLLPVPML
jgi:hypothetical protein